MEIIIENAAVFGSVFLGMILILAVYLRRMKSRSEAAKAKLENAIKFGFNEPVSLHPVIDVDSCIGSGACIEACPEESVLGMIDGQAHVINASRCIGHGACFHACPFHAISLCIGTETRGVELPHVSPQYETNVPGLFIAGELGGMGLIKNAVEQGKQAVYYLTTKLKSNVNTDYDLIIVGAGPAGLSATLAAAKNKLKYLTLEQESLGGTVFNFPRAKVVMTSPMELPLYGKVRLRDTSKDDLLKLWKDVLDKNKITVNENVRVDSIERKSDNHFEVTTSKGVFTSQSVLLAIGRRGTPRKLNVPGEGKQKVAYRLIEPEMIEGKKILVVGGGDSAIESALLLSENNRVTLSYRGGNFSRLKQKNLENITAASAAGKVKVILSSNVKEIMEEEVILLNDEDGKEIRVGNDLVFIFAGGTLPTDFLKKAGVDITKKYGDAILKHSK